MIDVPSQNTHTGRKPRAQTRRHTRARGRAPALDGRWKLCCEFYAAHSMRLILVWFGEEHKNVQNPSAPLDASPCRAVDFLFIRTSDDGRELHLDLCFVFPSVRAKTRAATDVCVRFAKFALRCGGTVVGNVPYCIAGCLSSERCANHQSDANPRVSPVFPTKRSLRPLFLLRLY